MGKIEVHHTERLDMHTRAIFMLIGTAILWSFGGVLIKMASINPVAIAGARSGIAALLYIAIIRKPCFDWSPVQICCAICNAATSILFVSATQMTTAANAILLQYTAPVYVLLLGAWILKERPTRIDWISVVFILGGMVLFFLDDLAAGNLLGNILAVLSGITFALMTVLMRFQKDGSPLGSVLLGNILTAVIGLPFMFGSRPDAGSLLGLVLLGVFQIGFSYLLYATAIKHATAIEGVLIPMLEPILNPIWVALFLGEIPGKWALIGGSIVIAAVAFRCIFSTMHTQARYAGSVGPSVRSIRQ